MAKKRKFYLIDTENDNEIHNRTIKDVVDYFNESRETDSYNRKNVCLSTYEFEVGEIGYVFTYDVRKYPIWLPDCKLHLFNGHNQCCLVNLDDPWYPRFHSYECANDSIELLKEVYEKAKALFYNMHLLGYYGDDRLQGAIHRKNIDHIECDIAFDENVFTIKRVDDFKFSTLDVELRTKEEVREIDRIEYMRVYGEMPEGYKLGEVYSQFHRLGETKYYYRFV